MKEKADALTRAAERWAQRCDPARSLPLSERVQNCLAAGNHAAICAALKAGKLELRLTSTGHTDADSRDFDRDNLERDAIGKWVIRLYSATSLPSDDEVACLAADALGFYAQIEAGQQRELARPVLTPVNAGKTPEKAGLPVPAVA